MNNLVKLDTAKLEKLANDLRDAVKRSDETRDQMFDNWLAEGNLLLKARQHFKSDTLFGQWLSENNIMIGKNERVALMAFASEPERARLVFDKTDSRSVRLIYDQEFRSPIAGKAEKPKAAPRPAPKTDAALGAYDALKAAGVAEPTREQVADKAGVGEHAAQLAIIQRKAEAAIIGQEPDIDGMPKTWASKYEAAVRRKVMQLEAEYDRRRMEQVQKHIDEYLMPFYREKLEKAERVMQVGKKPFTVDEYRRLLAALHPDSTPESRTKAFIMVKDRETLLRPPERDKPLSSDLPQTLAELLARKKRR